MWKENLCDFFHSAADFLELLSNCYHLRKWKDIFYQNYKIFTASKSRNNFSTLLKTCEIKRFAVNRSKSLVVNNLRELASP